MKIRDAMIADLPALAAIYDDEVTSGTSTFDTEPRDLQQQRVWFDAHQSPIHPLLVAADGARVLGWASLSPWSDRGAYARTVEASVFVHPDHRCRGVGRELLKAVTDRARAAGHRVVLGRIEASNQVSRRLLLGAGFASVGIMHGVGEKFGKRLDVEVFEMLL